MLCCMFISLSQNHTESYWLPKGAICSTNWSARFTCWIGCKGCWNAPFASIANLRVNVSMCPCASHYAGHLSRSLYCVQKRRHVWPKRPAGCGSQLINLAIFRRKKTPHWKKTEKSGGTYVLMAGFHGFPSPIDIPLSAHHMPTNLFTLWQDLFREQSQFNIGQSCTV